MSFMQDALSKEQPIVYASEHRPRSPQELDDKSYSYRPCLTAWNPASPQETWS